MKKILLTRTSLEDFLGKERFARIEAISLEPKLPPLPSGKNLGSMLATMLMQSPVNASADAFAASRQESFADAAFRQRKESLTKQYADSSAQAFERVIDLSVAHFLRNPLFAQHHPQLMKDLCDLLASPEKDRQSGEK